MNKDEKQLFFARITGCVGDFCTGAVERLMAICGFLISKRKKGWMDGRRNRWLTTPYGVGPLATVGRVKVSRRVSITSAFGQGTAGKASRAELAAPLTPAYGHCCAAARLDSDRWPRQSLFQRPHDQGNSADRPTDYYVLNRLRRNDPHNTDRRSNYDNLNPGLVEVTPISNLLVSAHVDSPAGHHFHARPEPWSLPHHIQKGTD
ncbi:hypothetical protein T10_3984 [Trichinella papuae]|uniref:Uncharacterized protein n=1 Tax=Trichinella papuae TaxID=268474 RepID=A0A0V1MRD4_9BILA|nr:hypothetical protein T10_3984 [Trichinella papuae]